MPLGMLLLKPFGLDFLLRSCADIIMDRLQKFLLQPQIELLREGRSDATMEEICTVKAKKVVAKIKVEGTRSNISSLILYAFIFICIAFSSATSLEWTLILCISM